MNMKAIESGLKQQLGEWCNEHESRRGSHMHSSKPHVQQQTHLHNPLYSLHIYINKYIYIHISHIYIKIQFYFYSITATHKSQTRIYSKNPKCQGGKNVPKHVAHRFWFYAACCRPRAQTQWTLPQILFCALVWIKKSPEWIWKFQGRFILTRQ